MEHPDVVDRQDTRFLPRSKRHKCFATDDKLRWISSVAICRHPIEVMEMSVWKRTQGDATVSRHSC